MVCVTHRAFLISLFSLCRGGLHELEELVEEASLAASNAPASSKLVSLRGTEEDSAKVQQKFKQAAELFDKQSVNQQLDTESKRDILAAMKTKSSMAAVPELQLPVVGTTCVQDFSRCPAGWTRRSMLCVSDAAVRDLQCQTFSLSMLREKQKRALARKCSMTFPCRSRTCSLDLDAACPAEWTEVADGTCHAPEEYVGGCAARTDAANMTKEERLEFGARCGAPWPCLHEEIQPRAYHEVCPAGWTVGHGSTCHATAAYAGSCSRTAKMEGASVADKQQFEADCGVSWRSLGKACRRTYAPSCPSGWRLDSEGDCLAPRAYAGGCKPRQKPQGSFEARRDFEDACGVRWPCAADAACSRNFAAACPAGWWSSDASTICHAPDTYQGVCEKSFSTTSLSTEAKRQMEKKCAVRWPCEEESA